LPLEKPELKLDSSLKSSLVVKPTLITPKNQNSKNKRNISSASSKLKMSQSIASSKVIKTNAKTKIANHKNDNIEYFL
jgi:hypothetical protein